MEDAGSASAAAVDSPPLPPPAVAAADHGPVLSQPGTRSRSCQDG